MKTQKKSPASKKAFIASLEAEMERIQDENDEIYRRMYAEIHALEHARDKKHEKISGVYTKQIDQLEEDMNSDVDELDSELDEQVEKLETAAQLVHDLMMTSITELSNLLKRYTNEAAN